MAEVDSSGEANADLTGDDSVPKIDVTSAKSSVGDGQKSDAGVESICFSDEEVMVKDPIAKQLEVKIP